MNFFLTNKTGAPYGEKFSWMKPMLKFSSINSLRVSCSDAKREYIRLTGG